MGHKNYHGICIETISLSCTAWLPPGESGAVDAEGQPVALYKIQYLNGPAAGYSEEVQENELQGLLVRDVDMAPAPVAAPVVPPPSDPTALFRAEMPLSAGVRTVGAQQPFRPPAKRPRLGGEHS